jgi:FMN-dependent NADH-azoreductase
MTTLLQLNSSLFLSGGNSSQLANAFVDKWQQKYPQTELIVRDLAAQPLPHLDAERVTAFFTPAEARSTAQQALVAESDALVAELIKADTLVIGMPMYNFGIPSTLKAYLDQIARAGITFRYTETGAVGLLTGKKAYVFATRGGLYAGTALDTETAYLRDFLGFLGISDVEFIYAEGLNMGEELKQQAMQDAQLRIAELLEVAV